MAVANYLIKNSLIDEEFLKTKTNAACLVKKDGSFLRRSDRDPSFEPQVISSNWMTGLPLTDDTPFVFDRTTDSLVLIDEAIDAQLEGPVTFEGVRYDTAFDRYKERVGEWGLDKAAELCGIDKSQIVALAEAIHQGPSSLMVGNGAGHTYASHTFFTATMGLSMLTGNFYKPGAGYANAGVSPVQGWSPDYTWPYMVQMAMPGPKYSPLELPEIIGSGKYLGKDAPIKSIIIHSGNPLGGDSGRAALLEALAQVEFIVTVDMSFTDSALMSDLVLPCCHWFETLEVGGAQYIPYALLGEQAVEPLFEHRSDYDICKAIAGALGLGASFSESLEEVNAFLTDNSPQPDYQGKKISWERLKKEKNIRTIPEGYYDTSCACQDGLLPLYIEKPAPRLPSKPVDEALEHLPYFEPPFEAWPDSVGGYPANALAGKYPLIYFNFHTHWMTHSTYSHIEWLKELWQEPFVEISPQDAQVRGISNRDIVRVFNDRGSVVVKAHIDGKIRPGTVSIPHGWQKDQFIEGHYQDLTSIATHPFDQNGNYWDGLCEVEPYVKGAAQ
jgi:molybdopterin-containing oxidoreductase family molybdopterin binding subunit